VNILRPTYHVENGRHPTVELGLLTAGRVFTPNTVSFSPGSSVHIITGPNMAGKSTLLRQTALIALLAQVGSFVPADSARLGIADQLFARVGAKDDLFRDRSTFMVEMLETAEILRRATSRSLVIMDEVGRGTTVQDGLAIAFGTIAHLHGVNHCRTLFATHFHELADMLGYAEDGRRQEETFAGIDFFCTDIQETEVCFWVIMYLACQCHFGFADIDLSML
jgi:DNA mismatch repair ATPase MutS